MAELPKQRPVKFGGDTSALLPGSLIFLVLGVVACLISVLVVRVKTRQPQYKNDNSCIAIICCIIATICMWIMWICTYMQQMNPLIFPEVSTE